jgi:hypothetical protein
MNYKSESDYYGFPFIIPSRHEKPDGIPEEGKEAFNYFQ